uniref:ABC transporter permease n=1 Tax=Candidatus Scatomorpha intestinigallinarum TaxID=2840923 RepID=UPI0040268DFA
LNTMDVNTNNLKAFKEFIESGDSGLEDYVSAIQYGYDLGFDVYTRDAGGKVVKSDVISLLNDMMGSVYGGDFSSYFDTMGDFYSSFEVWQEMLPGEGGSLIDDTVLGQYDVIYGSWPQSYDEVVLIVDKNNEVSDLVLYSLGLRTEEQMADGFEASMSGETLDAEVESWSYEELCGLSFKLIARPEYYVCDEETGGYTDLTATSAGMDYLYDSKDRGISLKISGIVRQNEDAVAGMMTGAIGYTSALTDKVIELSNEADIVKAQLADPGTDAILGLPFATGEEPEPTLDEIKADVDEYIEGLDVSGRAALYTDLTERAPEDYVELTVEQAMQGMTREYIEEMMLEGYAVEMGVDPETIRDYIADMDDETLMDYVREMTAEAVREQYADAARAQLAAMSAEQLAMALSMSPLTDEQYEYVYAEKLPPKYSESTYEENLELLGYVDKDSPSSISLYAASFADKDEIARIISEYNAAVEDEEDEISYTDYVAILMSSVSTIINAISYVLIAFVAISLVVSSIMIGIITYISVLERTKEIGILRSIGASKRDVSNVFNAETLIEGFAAGVIGIGVTLLLIIPINAIVQNLTGIESLRAILPASGGVALVVISMILTFIAGLIPSGFAARRDPVEALRTE